MIDVPVIRPFTHEGRAFTAGDTIRVSPIEAAALHRRGLVSLTKGARIKTRALTPDPPVAVRPRRRPYRRRDLTPEP